MKSIDFPFASRARRESCESQKGVTDGPAGPASMRTGVRMTAVTQANSLKQDGVMVVRCVTPGIPVGIASQTDLIRLIRLKWLDTIIQEFRKRGKDRLGVDANPPT